MEVLKIQTFLYKQEWLWSDRLNVVSNSHLRIPNGHMKTLPRHYIAPMSVRRHYDIMCLVSTYFSDTTKIYYSGGKTMINRMSYWEQMLKHKCFMNYRKMNITRQYRSRSVRSGLQPFRLCLTLGALLHCDQTFFYSFRKIKETAFISEVFFNI